MRAERAEQHVAMTGRMDRIGAVERKQLRKHLAARPDRMERGQVLVSRALGSGRGRTRVLAACGHVLHVALMASCQAPTLAL